MQQGRPFVTAPWLMIDEGGEGAYPAPPTSLAEAMSDLALHGAMNGGVTGLSAVAPGPGAVQVTMPAWPADPAPGSAATSVVKPVSPEVGSLFDDAEWGGLPDPDGQGDPAPAETAGEPQWPVAPFADEMTEGAASPDPAAVAGLVLRPSEPTPPPFQDSAPDARMPHRAELADDCDALTARFVAAQRDGMDAMARTIKAAVTAVTTVIEHQSAQLDRLETLVAAQSAQTTAVAQTLSAATGLADLRHHLHLLEQRITAAEKQHHPAGAMQHDVLRLMLAEQLALRQKHQAAETDE